MPPEKQPQVTRAKLVALLIMIAGAAIYCNGLNNVSAIGLAFATGNMVLAVSDRLIQRRLLTMECSSLTSSVCAIMNNTIGLLPTMVLAFGTHEVQGATSQEMLMVWRDPRIIILLLFSGLIGIGMCYLGFECQRAISCTSFFVVQNTSKIAVVCCGVFFFHDPIHSPMTVAGLVLSLSGSFLYAHTELKVEPEAKPLVFKADKMSKV